MNDAVIVYLEALTPEGDAALAKAYTEKVEIKERVSLRVWGLSYERKITSEAPFAFKTTIRGFESLYERLKRRGKNPSNLEISESAQEQYAIMVEKSVLKYGVTRDDYLLEVYTE